MDILRQFNEQSNNKFAIENVNYLESLNQTINKSIKQLSKFNVNSNTFLQIKSLYGDKFNTTEFNETMKITTINFLKTTLEIINSLSQNIISITSISIRDEYHKFHNNIIRKIKDFINHYIKYISILEQIILKIHSKLNEEITSINLLITNYNINSICNADPNFNRRHSKLKSNIDLLDSYYNYLDNNISIFNNIRSSFKNINTTFLKML